MKSIFKSSAGALAFCVLIFLCGCRSADLAQTGQMASLEITGHSEADILSAAKAVFLAEGYENPRELIFEKKGSLWDTAAYSGWDLSAVWTRVKFTIDPTSADVYTIGCDAYTVNDRNQGVLEDERKNSFSKRSDCKKILEAIKAKLDAGNAANPKP